MEEKAQGATQQGAEAGPPVSGFWGHLAVIGPGIAIAATGVGAGDMVATAAAGARFGYAVAWAALIGAILKYVLNEGLARWQLATGTTLLEGWVNHLGAWAKYFFLVYLIIWSFVVGAGLISGCGLAAYAITGTLSVEAWGAIHAVVGIVIVLIGSYAHFENMMKIFVGLMFVALLGCALWVTPPWESAWQSIRQATVPVGGTALILGMIGGVGGSLTLLSYGYWIREKEWRGVQWLGMVRLDLRIAYILTGIFGVAVVILGTVLLKPKGISIKGSRGIIDMATLLGGVIGNVGKWVFLFGFWGAVATSLLGVWQSVPYMFCDFVSLVKKSPPEEREAMVSTSSSWYRGYLLWLALLPISLLFFGKPVALIILYSVVGALFMPFIAGTLLYMNNNARLVGKELRNGWFTNVFLVLILALFVYLGVNKLSNKLRTPKAKPSIHKVTPRKRSHVTSPKAPMSVVLRADGDARDDAVHGLRRAATRG